MRSAALLLAGLLAALPQDEALGAKDAALLRERLAGVLFAPAAPATKERAVRARELAAFARGFRRDDVLAALQRGPAYPAGVPGARGADERVATFGEVRVGYAFEHEGARYRYAVEPPARYDPETPHALLIDPGHGTGKDEDDEGKAGFFPFWRGEVDGTPLEGCIVARTEIVEEIGTDGRRPALPEEQVAAVFDAFFRDLASRYHVDPDRVYVSGLSQTGFWTWYLGRFRADRFAGLAPMSAASHPADRYLANYLGVPLHVLQGEDDPTVFPQGPRETCARLLALGANVRYVELAEAGHDPAVWSRLSDGLEWLAAEPRDPWPRRVSKSLQTTRDGWCWWIRVDRLARTGDGASGTAPTGGIDGEIDGQTVRLFSEGVLRITLGLASALLDLDQPIEVVWNGERAFQGVPERDLARTLELAADRCDWRMLFEAALELDAP